MIYQKNHDVNIYPFVDKIPFPSGLIADIKIAVKKTEIKEIYVGNIRATAGKLSIGFMGRLENLSPVFLGAFFSQNNLWITCDNQNIFGLIKLNVRPKKKFSFAGEWHLRPDCVTFPVACSGLMQAGVRMGKEKQIVQSGSELKIRMVNNWDVVQNKENSGVVFRPDQPFYNYWENYEGQPAFVSGINGHQGAILQFINNNDITFHISPQAQAQAKPVCILTVGSSGSDQDNSKLGCYHVQSDSSTGEASQ